MGRKDNSEMASCQKYVPMGMAFFLFFAGAGFVLARSAVAVTLRREGINPSPTLP